MILTQEQKQQIYFQTVEQIKNNFNSVSWLIEHFLTLELNPITLEYYQKEIADCNSQFVAVNKARRIGWSALITTMGVVKANRYYDYHKYFISYNLEEAKDRIRIARMAYADMPDIIDGVKIKKKLRSDSKTVLEFEDWNGKSVSRLLSFPCRDLRGGKGDVDLDEFEFYQNQEAVYKSAMFVIATAGDHIPGGWRLSIGSTPLSKKGLFFRILTMVDKYTEFVRFSIPWWASRRLSINPFGEDGSIALAPYMTTQERVEVYGTPIIKALFASSTLEDFQQEMELSFQDEKSSFLNYDMIKECMPDGSAKEAEVKGDNIDDGILEEPTLYDLRLNKAEVPGFKTLDDFLANYNKEKHGIIYAGFDVGRKVHASELWLNGYVGGLMVNWLSETWHKTPYSVQKDNLRRLLRSGIVTRFCIDETGLGNDMAETMKNEFPLLVEPVTFTPANKEMLANGLYLLMQDKGILLLNDREIFRQLHSVKRTLTWTRHAKFDVDDIKAHADKFWACTLAVYGFSGGKLKRHDSSIYDRYLQEQGYDVKETNINGKIEKKVEIPKSPMEYLQSIEENYYG